MSIDEHRAPNRPEDVVAQQNSAKVVHAQEADGGKPEPTGRIFERHVFVCTGGDWCPAVDGDGLGVHARLKRLVAEAGLGGRVRVNKSGCLDQCGHGPMVVVYPDGVWYWGVRPEDADEIVREHLLGGRPVARLVYRNRPGKNKLPRDEQNRPVGRPAREERPEEAQP
jgi:(2Fe-2S) ferredoxin